LHALLECGRGTLILAGHLGNWELGASAVAACGVPIDVVAQRQRNPLFDRAMNEARRRLGSGVIERGETMRAGLRALRQNRVLAIVADQNAGPTGVFLPFFGKLASTTRGPAILAARARAPILLGVPLRQSSGRMLVRFELIADAERSCADEAAHIMGDYLSALENAVRSAPEQYFWHHKRWKTRPPEEARAESTA
jgi:KDO2-lipid IV(A) lauroyltransferase